MYSADENDGTGKSGQGDTQSVAYLDQALWSQLETAEDLYTLTSTWLALQCHLVTGVVRAVVVMKSIESGEFEPLAYWPKGKGATLGLTAAAEAAMEERKGVAYAKKISPNDPEPKQRYCDVAYPFVIDGELTGVVALEIESRPKNLLTNVIRKLQWGASWIETRFLKDRLEHQENHKKQIETVLDLTSAILQKTRFRDACTTLATELASNLDCERVSVGHLKRGRSHIVGFSHSAHFDKRMNLIRCLENAMDESIDQWSMLIYPPPDNQVAAARAHAELSREISSSTVMTAPMSIGDKIVGAITLERHDHNPFSDGDAQTLSILAAVSAPILEEKYKNDRWILYKILESIALQIGYVFGPRYLGRKLFVLLLISFGTFFTLAKDEYRITADTKLEGVVQRAIVAPYDGFIFDAYVRAGDNVEEGQVLASVDERDIVLERLSWLSKRRQHLLEYDLALAEGNRAQINIVKAQIDQASAQISLYDEQLSRAKISAPFSGFVVSGDLSQSIGGAIERGELLFEIAPLNDYRILLKVDEKEIADVALGQAGEMVVSSIPDLPLEFIVKKITPVSEAAEGANYFIVEASLTSSSHIDRLRPGMEGVGKINAGERKLLWIWSYKILDWFRLASWRWFP
ncbi:HlyD family efflux transporter periplasmic adaptor subunit [Kiloniella sp.]|uniref:HlyD family efflux transporter periplasmic adaptor subunit n=1 Tax=Kiloniella sp. TaxID=1938587 RepID=UPI003B029D8D